MSGYDTYVSGITSLAGDNVNRDWLPIYYAIAAGGPIVDAFLETSGNPYRVLRFLTGNLQVKDNAQSCCENRYLTTDDDLPSFVGASLVGVDRVEVEAADDDYGDVHEQMFVKLETTAGTITLVAHNEHNGYYGGFCIESEWVERS